MAAGSTAHGVGQRRTGIAPAPAPARGTGTVRTGARSPSHGAGPHAVARLHGAAPSEHPEALRLWLRLLTCTQLIEKQVRSHLRAQFDTTLPRFDLMAQLERAPDGMKMKELSRRMMVTSGNITGITDQLVAEGLVERMDVEGDRRAYLVRLTPQGREQFNTMARQHEQWIVEAFATLGERDIATLYRLLGKVKEHTQNNESVS